MGKKSLSQLIENCPTWQKKAKQISAGNGSFRRRFFTVPYCSQQKQLLCSILELELFYGVRSFQKWHIRPPPPPLIIECPLIGQDFIRTSTYQRAILDNPSEFANKVILKNFFVSKLSFLLHQYKQSIFYINT